MKNLLLALVVGGCVAAHAASLHASDEHTTADINGVIESFRLSIINKDKEKFTSLLAKADIPWIGVLDSTYIAHRTQDYPDFHVARRSFEGSPTAFIDGVIKNPAPVEEQFRNISIDSDGNIASVQFDYSFHSNGVKTNWGKEAWQLINTGSAWKITSVIWSVELPPKPTPPARTEVAVAAQVLADLPGTYEVKPGDRYVISLENGRLKVSHFQDAYALYGLSASQFFDRHGGATYDFIRNSDGQVTQFNLEASDRSVQARRVQ